MQATTTFGWSGTITEINKEKFHLGQGISITRNVDNEKFCIHPDNINTEKTKCNHPRSARTYIGDNYLRCGICKTEFK